MNVFIDANTLLDFYRLSKGDLEELRRLAALARAEKIDLYFSNVLQDEVERNRERVIAGALKEFEKSKLKLFRPNIVRSYNECTELQRLHGEYLVVFDCLYKKVLADSRGRNTLADEIIGELIQASNLEWVPQEVLDQAERRTMLGRPPGKKGSIGDAIHWEWLLCKVPLNTDLHLVSGDIDFRSSLQGGALSDYLSAEWQEKKKSRCRLYVSLTEFLKNNFPDINLSDELDMMEAFGRLENAISERSVIEAVKRLESYDDYTPDQILQLITAVLSNRAVLSSLQNDEVGGFAEKVVTLAQQNDLHHLATYLTSNLLRARGQED